MIMAVSFNKCENFDEFEQLLTTPFLSFTVLHVNIRSLRKHWEHFRVLVNKASSRIDVFVLTESYAPEATRSLFNLSGYNSFWFSRQLSIGGGVVIYVKNEWLVSRQDVTFNYAECILLKIESSNHSLGLLACYRPPSKSIRQFLQELKDTLSEIGSQGLFCIVGDMNIDLLKYDKSEVCDYLNILASVGIESTISAPTREELMSGRLVSSCIDHILVRTLDVMVKSAVISQKLSDHYFVGCQMTWPNAPAVVSNDRKTIQITDKKILDNLVSSYDWASFLESVSYSDVYSNFMLVHDSIKAKAQRTVVVRKRRPEHVWLSPQILAAISDKEKLWVRCKRAPKNVKIRADFRAARNRVNALVRSAKRIYFQEKFSESRSNIAQTWSLVNGLRGYQCQRSLDDVIVKNFGDNVSAVVENFNRFFATSSEQSVSVPVGEVTLNEANIASAFLCDMDEEGLRSDLFSMKCSRSPGADGVTVGFLQRNFDSLKYVILFMMNSFIRSRSVPEELKTAIVRPVFKGGKPTRMENYRPISILPVLGHLLEKHIFRIMSGFLDNYPLLSDSQYGFVPGRGTQLLLDDVADHLHSAFHDNMFSCALFLDVSKAFETVNHPILLSKLFKYGFRGPFFELLSDLLSGRSQRVRVGLQTSSPCYLRAGVPQGSVLSPLFFNIYINDLASAISQCSCYLYADDTLLISRHIKFDSALNILQSSANKAIDWYASNHLKVNPAKTRLICFRNPLKQGFINKPFFFARYRLCKLQLYSS